MMPCSQDHAVISVLRPAGRQGAFAKSILHNALISVAPLINEAVAKKRLGSFRVAVSVFDTAQDLFAGDLH